MRNQTSRSEERKKKQTTYQYLTHLLYIYSPPPISDSPPKTKSSKNTRYNRLMNDLDSSKDGENQGEQASMTKTGDDFQALREVHDSKVLPE